QRVTQPHRRHESNSRIQTLPSPARQQSPRMREGTAQHARGAVVADVHADSHEAGARERNAGTGLSAENGPHLVAPLDDARDADAVWNRTHLAGVLHHATFVRSPRLPAPVPARPAVTLVRPETELGEDAEPRRALEAELGLDEGETNIRGGGVERPTGS